MIIIRKEKLDDDNVTNLIVEMIAYYRDNKSRIQRLSLLSRIAGVCFLANEIMLLKDTTNNVTSGALANQIPLTVIVTILNFAVGASGILIPHYFSRYSSVWE